MSRVETKEERKARIMERAHALKDARERERQEFVKSRYDLRWRDACDDARTLDSKAMALFMDKQRQEQIEEKLRRKQGISSEEDAFLAYMRSHQRELEEAERRKLLARHDASYEQSRLIQEQVTICLVWQYLYL